VPVPSGPAQFYIGEPLLRNQKQIDTPAAPRSAPVKRRAEGPLDGQDKFRRRGGPADPVRVRIREKKEEPATEPMPLPKKKILAPARKKKAPPETKKKSDSPLPPKRVGNRKIRGGKKQVSRRVARAA
jgi:hypothetical protein